MTLCQSDQQLVPTLYTDSDFLQIGKDSISTFTSREQVNQTSSLMDSQYIHLLMVSGVISYRIWPIQTDGFWVKTKTRRPSIHDLVMEAIPTTIVHLHTGFAMVHTFVLKHSKWVTPYQRSLQQDSSSKV